MLERHHLQILQAIEQQGSLSGAAKALNLTQPALTHSIKKLESRLGTPLWRKQGRQLRLTRAGRYALGVAQRVLPQFERAEARLADIAAGRRGALRIGMECHPCYQWLLQVVRPYLCAWPDVDLDVKQRFQFGGMGALVNHEIDVLVTPDPLPVKGVRFIPVFAYEQVLVLAHDHPLAAEAVIQPAMLAEQTLITYPVEQQRLDIYSQFLLPARATVARQKVIETTDIMLQMVAAGRGVTALPRWLVQTYPAELGLVSKPLGAGLFKQIHLGYRQDDEQLDYLQAFITLAREYSGLG